MLRFISTSEAIIDLEPPCDELLARLGRHPRLEELGMIRQGIAENPNDDPSDNEPAAVS